MYVFFIVQQMAAILSLYCMLPNVIIHFNLYSDIYLCPLKIIA